MAFVRGAGRAAVVLFVSAVALAGCASTDSGAESSPSPSLSASSTAPLKAADLAGSNWQLKSAAASHDWAKFDITLKFGEGQEISGTSGVNRYTGTYVATDAGGLKFGPLASTKMAGPDDAMAAEAAFLKLMGQVTGFRYDGQQLVLLGSESQELLTFGS